MKLPKWFFILLFGTSLFAQNHQLHTIDSLLTVVKKQQQDTLLAKNLNLISRNYVYQDSEKGILYAQKAQQLSEKLDWKFGIGEAFLNMGMHEVSKGNYSESQKKLDEAKKIFLATNNVLYMAKVHIETGILKANQSKYPESLDYFFKALALFESINTKDVQKSIGSCYENIGTIYNLTNSYDNAIKNYSKAIRILSKIKNKEVQVALNNANIGIIYQKKNELKKALERYKIAEKELDGFDDNFALAFVNSWMGSAYLVTENFDLSIQKSNKALEYLTFIKDKELISSTTQNLGYAEFKKGKITKNNALIEDGLAKITASINLYQELKNHEGLMKSYLYLSEYYTYKKSFEKALVNYKLYSVYNDSIYNFKNKQSLQNLQDQRTIDLSEKEIQVNKLTISNKEKQKWYLIFGLLSLGIIGSLLFFQSRNRKKTNEKLQLLNSELDEANKAKTRFFSILNHDLRGPVANLVAFLQLQMESPEMLDEESIKRMQDKTMAGAENLLHSMEDILQWSKSQMENFKPQPKNIAISSLFEDTKTHFSSEEKVQITFENSQNIQINTDENYLKTIIRNLTGNAIKALDGIENPNVIWNAWQENNLTYLSITDNGKGASNEQFKALYDDKEVVGIKTGLGLHLIRDLAKAIDCKIEVDSKINNGTTFILQLK
ncbi:MAG: tetratricopeptide repeat-containing sensor histidine kinase [Bacteroidota bacterium]